MKRKHRDAKVKRWVSLLVRYLRTSYKGIYETIGNCAKEPLLNPIYA